MEDKHLSNMNYFDKIIKYDPVNNYYVFTNKEFINLKRNFDKNNSDLLVKKFTHLFDAEKSSVTSKKKEYQIGNLHNYVSLATYYWKSDTPNGLPYHNRDGYANPEGAFYDKDKFRFLAYLTYYAGLMYYLTEKKEFYDLLKEHCYVWFINEKTRMNPNMDYAQYIPGINKGRGIGIIDYSANFSYSLHILTHLYNLGLLEESFYQDLGLWFSEFRSWLKNSKNGKDEYNEPNNHGTMYDFGLITIDLFLNDFSNFSKYKKDFLEKRINTQIDEFGRLPLELKRTKSKNYSLMAAKAFNDYYKLLKEHGFEIVSNKISMMNKWLIERLVLEKEDWPYKQITEFDKSCLLPLVINENRIKDLKIDKSDYIFDIPLYIFSLIGDKNEKK